MRTTNGNRIGPGTRFGSLTVESDSGQRRNGYIVWTCRCDCGNTIDVDMRTLKRGTVTDCGCLKQPDSGRRDITGLRFGKLTALYGTGDTDGSGSPVWHLRCDCGNEIDLPLCLLSAGRRRSCGCLSHPQTEEYIGKRFGRLTVTGYAGKWSRSHHWTCRCDCGNELVVSQSNLKDGHTKSCGCLFAKRRRESMKLVDGTSVTFLETRRGRVNANNTSGHSGVYRNAKTGRWTAQIGFRGHRYFLGAFEEKEEAVQARIRAESMYEDFLDWYHREYESNVFAEVAKPVSSEEAGTASAMVGKSSDSRMSPKGAVKPEPVIRARPRVPTAAGPRSGTDAPQPAAALPPAAMMHTEKNAETASAGPA